MSDNLQSHVELTRENAILAWHFLPQNGQTTHDENVMVRAGQTLALPPDEKPELCEYGYHASINPVDALHYAPGLIVQRCELWGYVSKGEDKLVASKRTCVFVADAIQVIVEFAKWCAERAKEHADADAARYAADAARYAADAARYAADAARYAAAAARYAAADADAARYAAAAAAADAVSYAAADAAARSAADAARSAADAARYAAAAAAADAVSYAAADAVSYAADAEHKLQNEKLSSLLLALEVTDHA